MKNFSLARVLSLVSILSVLAFSSCNRGYGCPTNFSLNDSVIDLVMGMAHLLF